MFRSAERWCIIASIVLTETILCVNTVESGIAKQPVFVIGAALASALFAAECLLLGRAGVSFSAAGILAALHIPLFAVSAVLTFDPVHTPGAFAFGVSCIVFFFAGASLFSTRREVALLMTVIEALTVLLCVAGAVQLAAGGMLPLDFHLGAYDRVPSLLGHGAFFSAYLIVVFPLILARTFSSPLRGANLLRFLLLAAVVVLLLATRTRSSLAGWIVSLAVFLLAAPFGKRTKHAVLILAAVAAFGCLYAAVMQPGLGRSIINALDEGRGSTLARRMYFWTAGRDAFAASPLTGHGTGSYERMVFEYRNPDYWQVRSEDIVPHAHNEVIEIAVEYGAIGLALFAATMIVMVLRALFIARRSKGWEGWMGAGSIGALAAIAVDNLANVSLREAPIAALVWLLMGVLWSPLFAPRSMDDAAAAVSDETGREGTVVRLLSERRWNISFPLRLPKIAAIVPILLWLAFTVWYVNDRALDVESSSRLLRAMETADRNARDAAAECEEAVALDPRNLLARSYLSQEYANAGRWSEALRSAEELQRWSPSYPKSSLVKAYALLHLGNFSGSLQSIREELRRRSHPEAFLIQASAFRAIHDAKGERAAFGNLIRKVIASKTIYPYREACERLVALSATESEKRETAELIEALRELDPPGRDFLAKELEKVRTDAPR